MGVFAAFGGVSQECSVAAPDRAMQVVRTQAACHSEGEVRLEITVHGRGDFGRDVRGEGARNPTAHRAVAAA